MKICYWLIPAEPHLSQFSRVIRELAAQFDAPVFLPHVTVYSGPLGSKDQPARTLTAIAQALAPVELRGRGISFSNEFTQTLFLEFAASDELTALSGHLKRASAPPRDYTLTPHLSLLYANIDERIKRELAARLAAPEFTPFDTLQAVVTGNRVLTRADVEAWRLVAEVRLS